MEVLLFVYFALLLFFTLVSFRYLYLIVGFFNNRKFWSLKTPPLRRYPKVCVQLPVYNEPFVVERAIRSSAKLIWPKDKLEIQVLDDSNDETSAIASAVISELSKEGINIRHIRRGNREGFKAGALRYGMELTDAEYFAIFDADFIPPEDFLLRTIPFLERDPKLAGVQTRWDFINGDDNLFTKAQRFMLNLHFVLEQFVRSRENLWLTFNGTAGVLKRSAIEWVGGWEADTLTEDSDLSFRLYKKGYKILYLPDVTCKSELPDSPVAFKAQQRRWAKGGAQVFRKYWRELLNSNIPISWKVEFLFQSAGNLGYPLGMLLMNLLPFVLYAKFKGYYPELFLLMGILAIFNIFVVWLAFAIANFYYRKDISEIAFIPLGMALVGALTINNTISFLEGLKGEKGTFERTPKAGDKGVIINDVGKKLEISKLEILWGLYLVFVSILSVFLNQLILGFVLGVSGFGLLWLGSSSYLQILGYESFDLVLDEETEA
ncbi:glycosyltransferase [Candidatus Caldipriscus sp.]|nr:glycosyltransferase [Candidatus Caldipriscus sp.]